MGGESVGEWQSENEEGWGHSETQAHEERGHTGSLVVSVLTLSNVISSYSISPSVPFTCNSNTGQKHNHSETDIAPAQALPVLLSQRPPCSTPSPNLNNSHILGLLGCLC